MKEEENFLIAYTIFIVLNLMIAIPTFIFIIKKAEGASFYETIYSKKISYLIESSKPGTTIILDISKCYEISSKSGIEPEFSLSGSHVTVRLAQGAGKTYSFLQDLSVKLEPLKESQQLMITINEKSGGADEK